MNLLKPLVDVGYTPVEQTLRGLDKYVPVKRKKEKEAPPKIKDISQFKPL